MSMPLHVEVGAQVVTRDECDRILTVKNHNAISALCYWYQGDVRMEKHFALSDLMSAYHAAPFALTQHLCYRHAY